MFVPKLAWSPCKSSCWALLRCDDCLARNKNCMICNGPGIKPGTDNDSPVVPKIETRRTWYWYPVDYSLFITMRRFSLDHGTIKSSRNVSCTTTVFAKRIYECREALWLDCHITTYGEPWWACLTSIRSDNNLLIGKNHPRRKWNPNVKTTTTNLSRYFKMESSSRHLSKNEVWKV